jgi:hypothetical protein
MGWVGPAKWAKISPRKGWVGPISAQHIIFYFFFSGPNLAQTFGPGQNLTCPKGGVNCFPPSLMHTKWILYKDAIKEGKKNRGKKERGAT